MRLNEPRVGPLPEDEWGEESQELLRRLESDRRVLNIYRTLANHPKLLKRWSVFGTHVLFKNTLPPRERELLILRTGWLRRSEYEWGQHVLIARGSGVSDAEIERGKEGPEADGWDAADAALLRAADELIEDAFVTDVTWQALSERFGTEQLIDIIFTVGQYNLVSMALNTLGVQLDDGVEGF
ncbi:MAG TPA: carboxymuconolactone decarboxylase family protein [Dehalococcoidia bacterium]